MCLNPSLHVFLLGSPVSAYSTVFPPKPGLPTPGKERVKTGLTHCSCTSHVVKADPRVLGNAENCCHWDRWNRMDRTQVMVDIYSCIQEPDPSPEGGGGTTS